HSPVPPAMPSFPPRRSSDLAVAPQTVRQQAQFRHAPRAEKRHRGRVQEYLYHRPAQPGRVRDILPRALPVEACRASGRPPDAVGRALRAAVARDPAAPVPPRDLLDLLDAVYRPFGGLGEWVDSFVSQTDREVVQVELLGGAHPVIVVHRVVETLIER